MSGDAFDTAKAGDRIVFAQDGVEFESPHPDVQAIIEIDMIMRSLRPEHRRAVIAWFTARTTK